MQDIAFYCLDYLFNITLLLSLDFLNQSCTIFEADLVSSSHVSGGSLAHAVKELVEGCELASVSDSSNGIQRALNSSENSAE